MRRRTGRHRTSALLVVDRCLALLRVLAAVVVAMSIVTDRSVTSFQLGRVLATGAIVAALVLAGTVGRASGSVDHLAVRVLSGLVLDAAAAAGGVALLAADPSSAVWLVLLLPVIEGALRFGLSGVVLTWAGLTGLSVLRLAWSWQAKDGLSDLHALVQPMALLLIVGLPLGYLIERLVIEIESQQVRREQLRRRTDLLSTLITTAAQLARPDFTAQHAALADSVTSLGLAWADIWIRDGAGRWQQVALSGSRPDDLPVAGSFGDGAHDHPDTASGLLVRLVGAPETGTLMRAGPWSGDAADPDLCSALETLVTHAANAFATTALLAELEQERAALAARVIRDPLTQLLNRTGLQERTEGCLAGLQGEEALALVLVDLDGFKAVNDTLGHAAGDQLLQQVARELAVLIPAAAALARLGGDEFVVLMERSTSCSSADDAGSAAARSIGDRLVVHAGDRVVRASAGHGVASRFGTVAALLRAADEQMYLDKQSRRVGVPLR